MWYALVILTRTSDVDIYSKPEPVCIDLSLHIIVAATWVFKEVYGITGEDDLSKNWRVIHQRKVHRNEPEWNITQNFGRINITLPKI